MTISRLTAAFLLLAVAGNVRAQTPAEAPDTVLVPDIVLVNAKVLTVDPSDTIAEAVAIRGNRISAVGGSAEIKALAGEGTRVIDLGGRTVIPGLIDSHIHAIRGGLTHGAEVHWSETKSLKQGLEQIAAAAAAQPAGTWINVVGGWHKTQFPENRLPTVHEITEAAGDHPAYVQYLYKEAVLNPLAMEALGIKEDSDVPPAGRLDLDGGGEATGHITGNVPTFARLYARLPKPDFAGQVAGTRAIFAELNRLGMTGIVDPSGGGMFPRNYRPLFQLWRSGEMTLRVAYRAMSQHPGKELEDLKERGHYLPQNFGDDWLRFVGFGEVIIWEMHDGDSAGLKFTPSAEAKAAFREAALWMAENGYTAEIHASSDTSARLILDIIEDVDAEAPVGDLRWSIAHLDDGTRETLRRMKALGLAWSLQDRFYFAGDDLLEKLGAERVRSAPPIKSALDLGVVVAGGSDSPRISTYNPWLSIRWLLDGKSVSRRRIRGPGETPSRAQALRIYTLNSAWMSFDENKRGSIEPGKLADLAVLSADYMTVPVEDIGAIESLLTMVDGRIVWAAGPFADRAP